LSRGRAVEASCARRIAADRYPLSRRIRNLKAALAKLDPQPEPVVEPVPPPRRWVNSMIGKKRGRWR